MPKERRAPAHAPATSVVAIVDTMSAEQLRRTLVAAPHVVAAFAGSGPLAGYFDHRTVGKGTPPPDRARLAAHLAHAAARRLTLQLLDPLSLQLLTVLITAGGTLSTAELEAETGPLTAPQRDAIVVALEDRILVRRTATGIAAVDAVDTLVGRSGRSVQSLLSSQSVTRDDLGGILRSYGVTGAPTTKQLRIDALAGIVGDRANVLRIRSVLRTDAGTLLDRLLEAGAAGLPSNEIGFDAWHFQVYGRLPHRNVPGAIGALMELDDLGLVWIEPMADRVGTWLEVIRAIHGRLVPDWPRPPTFDAVPVAEGAQHLPVALSTLHGLLASIGIEALPGLKSGGIGVKVIRDLGKRLGQPEHDIDLLLHLALALGLIRHEEEIVGRGRAASWVLRYVAEDEQIAAHATLGPGEQWVALVGAWAAGRDAADDRFHQVVVRFQVLHDLLALPDGTGIPTDDFGDWVRNRHWVARLVQTDSVVTDLRSLGLVPAAGPVGLTAPARVLLTDPTRVDELLPVAIASFVVQADHTVVAPPTLEPALRSTLERLATVQSTGSATVYRLDPTKIGAHLADGHTAADILAFLAAASTVGVPPTVARLLDDLERQRGGLAVHAAATVVTADDVMGLAVAVKVKTARLTLLAPTVAISDLPPAKVIAALRTKGLAPSVANGRVTLGGATPAKQATRKPSVATSAGGTPPVAARAKPRPILVDRELIDVLVDSASGGARR